MATAILIVCLVLMIAIAAGTAGYFHLAGKVQELQDQINMHGDSNESILALLASLEERMKSASVAVAKRETKPAVARKNWPQLRAEMERKSMEEA